MEKGNLAPLRRITIYGGSWVLFRAGQDFLHLHYHVRNARSIAHVDCGAVLVEAGRPKGTFENWFLAMSNGCNSCSIDCRMKFVSPLARAASVLYDLRRSPGKRRKNRAMGKAWIAGLWVYPSPK